MAATVTAFPRARIVRLVGRQPASRLVPEPPVVILAEDADAIDRELARERRRLIGRAVLCLTTGWRGQVTECQRRNSRIEGKFWTSDAAGTPLRFQWIATRPLAPYPRGAA
jgi:hypothetical protein